MSQFPQFKPQTSLTTLSYFQTNKISLNLNEKNNISILPINTQVHTMIHTNVHQ